MQRILHNLEELQELAAELAAQLTGRSTLLLSGPLGSGKTAFVRALGQALGIPEKIVSPTFTIVAEYSVPHHSTIHTLVHADLYRLEGEQARHDVAVRDMLERTGEKGRLTVIEWAERLGESVPKGTRIRFDHGEKETERVVTVE